MRSFKEFKEAYKGSLKSMDTEETIDLMFYRPIGFAWALLAAKFGITPNMITIASIFLGVAGGVLFYFYEPQMMLLNIVVCCCWCGPIRLIAPMASWLE